MAHESDAIMARYDGTESGFQTILDILQDHILDALEEVSGLRGKKWVETRNALGIYAITRRRKSPSRLGKKVLALAKKGEMLTVDTFYKYIPDIVGARVICLHPDNLLNVAKGLKTLGEMAQLFSDPPGHLTKLRVRSGVLNLLPIADFEKAGFTIDEPQEVGYTSIHFIFRLGQDFAANSTREQRDHLQKLRDHGIIITECLVEIQLRTILEEAWGEMDHWIRYEDESLADDPELKSQFAAMAAYIQAGNRHISLIKSIAQRKDAIRIRQAAAP